MATRTSVIILIFLFINKINLRYFVYRSRSNGCQSLSTQYNRMLLPDDRKGIVDRFMMTTRYKNEMDLRHSSTSFRSEEFTVVS